MTVIPASSIAQPQRVRPVNPSNRFGLDYEALAANFPERDKPIVDAHTHIGGLEAAKIFRRAADLYGVGTVYTMVPLPSVEDTIEAMGETVRFIAVPNFRSGDAREEFGPGYLRTVEKFHELGSRIVKFWVAPRSIDYAEELGDPGYMKLDSPYKIEVMQAARDMGMAFMVHVADPDTWFATKYADADKYGTKLQQYEPFEQLMERFNDVQWIAAHMAGWPEDLGFLSGLLDRHPNLSLDCSACKWQVRELSRHSDDELLTFFRKYSKRIMFGSDIVSTEEHLEHVGDDDKPMYQKASSPDEAFDLYASRYWAYRTMFETDYDGESPIADPDLEMIDPETHDAMSAPLLRGRALPEDLLDDLYNGVAERVLDPLFD